MGRYSGACLGRSVRKSKSILNARIKNLRQVREKKKVLEKAYKVYIFSFEEENEEFLL